MAKGTRKSSDKFQFSPKMRIVVLAGKDPYLLTRHTRDIVDALKEAHGEIEQFEFDGDSAEAADVLDELRSYGLMQQHKLIILDKADEFLAEKRTGHRSLMEKYAANPVDSATLLMRADTWRAGKIDKLIAKVGVVHKFEQPTVGKAITWAEKRVQKEYEVAIEPDAAERLVELTGPDLAMIDTELAKLAAYVSAEGRDITANDVAALVGMSREDKVWSLQVPIVAGRTDEAMSKFHELMQMSRDQNATRTLIAWALCDLMRKVHAASQMLRQGAHAGTISKQLKLWGDSQRAILDAARRHEPATLAGLLDRAIRTDWNSKSGLGKATRSLEVLTMQIADTMGKP